MSALIESMRVTVRQGFEPLPLGSPDLRILIDVFRASTTALAILDKKPSDFLITNSLETLQSLAQRGYRVVSEVFDLGIDNSPTLVRQQMSEKEKVVQKTANLTTALEKNFLDGLMILACFNNLKPVVEFVRKNHFHWIEIVPAGLMEKSVSAKEDTSCAEMLKAEILTGEADLSLRDLLLKDIEEIKSKKEAPLHYLADLQVALALNISTKIPQIQKVGNGIYRVDPL